MTDSKQNCEYYSDLSKVDSKDVYNQLPEYTRIAKYAQHNRSKKRRENWKEQVDRVFKMHKVKFQKHLDNTEFMDLFNFSKDMVDKKFVLGSQRALQFGGPSILNKETRMYNCCTSYVDRPRVFQEIMFCLLCGVGVGFSVQLHHIAKLPSILHRGVDSVTYKVSDSIEGWSDAIGVMMSSYFRENQPFPEYYAKEVEFDFSLIRKEGSHISNIGGKAPGHKGLKDALNKINDIFINCLNLGLSKLRPIDAYDIILHSSDAVLSGGIRRSACLALFSLEDDEMIKAKTGDWYIKNPHRGRSNNSVLLLRDKTPENKYMELIESVKQFGEPGVIWSDSTEALYNPCVEIGLYSYDSKGQSGFSFCNLCEINMATVNNEQDFYDRCKAASILGTFQAAYTNFGYLGKITEDIVKREALLGVSMTGMMDSPSISFDPVILEKGATIVKQVNEIVAKIIGINKSARTTCVKPAGTSSCILGTSSGIHPCHSTRYFRRVQSNMLEEPLKHFEKYNPQAIETSAWSSGKTDKVITFLCKSKPGALIKSDVSAIGLLEKVKLVQKHWVTVGKNDDLCVQPWLNHNVSNTITIKADEWNEAAKFIYDNRYYFAGISMLSETGDMTYHQAPFQAVYTHEEISKLYGAGSVFASGLIVYANDAFDNNLYTACATLMGYGEKLEMPNLDDSKMSSLVQSDKIYKKLRWVAQAKKFAKRHFNWDILKMTYCLKAVDSWKTWCDLKRTYKHVEWEDFTEENDNTKPTEYYACSGGSCEIIRF